MPKSKMKKTRSPKKSKYYYYERAVQDPSVDTEFFDETYYDLYKRKARFLREDFCGTFQISCEWVKQNSRNIAWALDLDPEPLAYGKSVHLPNLSESERKRIHPLRKNVLNVTKPKVDIVAACNFSICFFKKRSDLVHYFRFVYRSLQSKGLMIMDLVGGTEMGEAHIEKTKIGKGKDRFTYVWEAGKFNPIKNESEYWIHFYFPDGTKMKKAFYYPWRIWTVPEIREAMEEAGFRRTFCYWEGEDENGDGNGIYNPKEDDENSAVWISYIVGAKT